MTALSFAIIKISKDDNQYVTSMYITCSVTSQEELIAPFFRHTNASCS